MISGRMVSESSPRARLAARLLPASRSPLISTAVPIGTPFQWVTSTPSPKPGAVKPVTMLVTR